MDWRDSKVREDRIVANVREWRNLVKCSKCGYEWVTKSVLGYVTCPSCMRKVKRIKEVKD